MEKELQIKRSLNESNKISKREEHLKTYKSDKEDLDKCNTNDENYINIKLVCDNVEHKLIPMSDVEIKNFKERKKTPRKFSGNTNHDNSFNSYNSPQSLIEFNKGNKNLSAGTDNSSKNKSNNLQIKIRKEDDGKVLKTYKRMISKSLNKTSKQVKLKCLTSGSLNDDTTYDTTQKKDVIDKGDTNSCLSPDIIRTDIKTTKSNNIENILEDCMKNRVDFEDAFNLLVNNNLIEEVDQHYDSHMDSENSNTNRSIEKNKSNKSFSDG